MTADNRPTEHLDDDIDDSTVDAYLAALADVEADYTADVDASRRWQQGAASDLLASRSSSVADRDAARDAINSD